MDIRVATFNLLCPAYRRLTNQPDDMREAEFPRMYLTRSDAILRQPIWQTADIICCQEFWYANQQTFDLYVRTLQPHFLMHGLQRPGHGVLQRPDGLFMAISRRWEVIHEADIDFEDAAGRCAQLLHLRRRRGGDDHDDGDDAAGEGGEGGEGGKGGEGGAVGEGGTADSTADDDGARELLVANVHLLFPHNEAPT